MNRRIFFRRFAFAVALLCALLLSGCGGGDKPEIKPDKRAVKELPDKDVKVYWGMSRRWAELSAEENLDKWTYVRNNLDGWYTGFIDMWMVVFQNYTGFTPLETLRKICNVLPNKSCFFEGSMETKVNNSADGYNNEVSDKRTLDLLVDAGFSVDYASLNYMRKLTEAECSPRIELLRTYRGKRKCFSLQAPWYFEGDISKENVEACTGGRRILSWTDGAATDGPMGLWATNHGSVRQGSCSLVKYCATVGKPSAIMLSPYESGADPEVYDNVTDFLKTGKECVMYHEDNGAAPDMWTVWMYGGTDMDLMPESTVDSEGHTVPVNTAAGMAYWLLKHLNSFPVAVVDSSAATKVSDQEYNIAVTAGRTLEIPLTFSIAEPTIELSPVLRAVRNSVTENWNITFTAAGVDVTDAMIYNGGMNCIGKRRLTDADDLHVTMSVTPPSGTDINGASLQIQAMSHISNTVNKSMVLTINFR